jgi:cation transporter-like permease
MLLATHTLAQSVPRFSSSYALLFVLLFVAGTIGWLVATVLGFARARAFGASARWFALSALAMLIFHLYLVVVAWLGMTETDIDKLLSIGAFIIAFPALAALCAIVGFVRLTDPRR